MQKLEEIGHIKTLNFANNNQNLLSNRGIINIKKDFIIVLTSNLSSD